MTVCQNTPELWIKDFPDFSDVRHKYDRGHAAFIGGKDMTGATCLAAHGATRAGLGLATIISPDSAYDVYRSFMPHVIVKKADSNAEKAAFAENPKINVIVIGSGYGADSSLKGLVLALLSLENKKYVLDADAITVFEKTPEKITDALFEDCVLTPHEGEFKKIFGDFDDKIKATVTAAGKTGAVIVHKGVNTVVAAPDGQYCMYKGTPFLATAGTGDVLAGIIGGLLGQKMAPHLAAAAGVWLHGQAGRKGGRSMISADLPGLLSAIFDDLDKL